MPSLNAACLGKIPTHGDFVRHRASTPTMRAFDEWIRKGLHRSQKHKGWENAYDKAPPVRFLFSQSGRQTPNALLGTLRASRDRKGRTYPFAIVCEVPPSGLPADHLSHLPSRAHRFYTEAEEIVQGATTGAISHSDVTDQVTQMDPSFSLDASPTSAYRRYAQGHGMEPFLNSVLGTAKNTEKYHLFGDLTNIVLPQRDRSRPQLNYGVLYPLGEREDIYTNVACFWLEVTLRLLGHPDAQISFFWTPCSPEVVSPFLLLFIGSPKSSAVFHAFTSDTSNEDIFRLGPAADGSGRGAPSLPDQYKSLLESGDLSLREFLERM